MPAAGGELTAPCRRQRLDIGVCQGIHQGDDLRGQVDRHALRFSAYACVLTNSTLYTWTLQPLLPLVDSMRKEKRTKVVTLRLKPSTRRGLAEMAEADRRPFATFLAMVLEDYYEAAKEKAAAGQRKR